MRAVGVSGCGRSPTRAADLEPALTGQLTNRFDEVFLQGAADAPIGQFDQFLLGSVEMALPGN